MTKVFVSEEKLLSGYIIRFKISGYGLEYIIEFTLAAVLHCLGLVQGMKNDFE